MKYLKKISYAIAIAITFYAGYSYTLTVAQRRQKIAIVEDIIAKPTISSQDKKTAQDTINELKKGESARYGIDLQRKFDARLAQGADTPQVDDLIRQLDEKSTQELALQKKVEDQEVLIAELKKVSVGASKAEAEALKSQIDIYKNELFQIEAILGSKNFNLAKDGKPLALNDLTGKTMEELEELKKSKVELGKLLADIKVNNLAEAQEAIKALKAASKAENVQKLTDQVTKLGSEKTGLEEKLKVANERIKEQDNLLTDCEEKAKNACKQIEKNTKISNEEIKKVIGVENFDRIQGKIVTPLINEEEQTAEYTTVLRLAELPDNSEAFKQYNKLDTISKKYAQLEPSYDTLKAEMDALKASQAVGNEMPLAVMKIAVGPDNFERIIKIAEAAQADPGANLQTTEFTIAVSSMSETSIRALDAIEITNMPKDSSAFKDYNKAVEKYPIQKGKFIGNIDKNITEYIGTQGIKVINTIIQAPNATEFGNIEPKEALKLDALNKNSTAYKQYKKLERDLESAAKGKTLAADSEKELAKKETEIAKLKSELGQMAENLNTVKKSDSEARRELQSKQDKISSLERDLESATKGKALAADSGKGLVEKEAEITRLKTELEKQKEESAKNLKTQLEAKDTEAKNCNDQREKAINFAKNIISNAKEEAETLIPATFGVILGASKDNLTKTVPGFFGGQTNWPKDNSFALIEKAAQTGDSNPLAEQLRLALKSES